MKLSKEAKQEFKSVLYKVEEGNADILRNTFNKWVKKEITIKEAHKLVKKAGFHWTEKKTKQEFESRLNIDLACAC